jgi:hypothetical protein
MRLILDLDIVQTGHAGTRIKVYGYQSSTSSMAQPQSVHGVVM